MRTYVILGSLISIMIIFLIIYYIPSTDDFSPDNPLYNGLSEFVNRYNVTRISIQDLGRIEDHSIVFIIGPGRNFTSQEIDLLKKYLLRGGVVFIADDFGTAQEILDLLNTNVSFYRGVLKDPLFMYRNSYLPRVDVKIGGERLHLYMNYGTALNISAAKKGSCIGFSSIFSYIELYDEKGNITERLDGPLCIFYNMSVGEGVLYIFSDSSIFINSMIDLGDNNVFINTIISSRPSYVISDKWSMNLYTKTRLYLIDLAFLILNSVYKYLMIFTGAVVIYIVFYRISMRGVRKIDSEKTLRKVLEKILEKHPDWDRKVLERIVEEERRQ